MVHLEFLERSFLGLAAHLVKQRLGRWVSATRPKSAPPLFGDVSGERHCSSSCLECDQENWRRRQGCLMTYFGNADRMRRMNSALMTTLTAVCTLLAVGLLLLILSYISWQGIGSLTFQFLVDRPRPVGEGGGIGNAILGTLVLLTLSSALGLPLGIAVGVYLSEIGKGRFADIVRFLVDTLTGIPSIVTGVFVYAILVLPMKHFSALAGGVALPVIMVTIVARTTEGMLKLVPHSLP